ncbi:unnamed protein product [Cuscuta epithymum]|uniref:Uncharacterized protein n=1 Tax=Cuscuta epithymum TaxID=186058 RepID=A0AAV0DJ44_9ASTE|nr:unnamed protein product [Cuscuta epithymum]
MASTASLLVPTLPVRSSSSKPRSSRASPAALTGRRQWLLLLLTATTTLKGTELPSRAEKIGLFGVRKRIEKLEEEAELLVKEGFEMADKGIEAAEREIESAEEEIEAAVSFGGLAQAGVVAGAELIGILIATSVVSGILGPEAKKS